MKVISEVTTNGMSHHIKGCLIECLPEVIILRLGTNNLSRNASADDIAIKIASLERYIKTRYNQVYILLLTVLNDKWGKKGNQVSQLLSSQCQAAEIPFLDNTSITREMLKKRELHLNPVGTKVLLNNIC